MRVPFPRRPVSILTWPFGVALTSWVYVWRTTPIYRRELAGSLQRDAPLALARFRKTAGAPWRMERGDEFVVRMPGPWDGPVRVIDMTPHSFRFGPFTDTSRPARSSGAPAMTTC